jgi:hypothetical protein
VPPSTPFVIKAQQLLAGDHRTGGGEGDDLRRYRRFEFHRWQQSGTHTRSAQPSVLRHL